MARNAADITLGDILIACEGHFSIMECLNGLYPCERESICASHLAWKGLQDCIYDYINGVTLEDIVKLGAQDSGGDLHDKPRACDCQE